MRTTITVPAMASPMAMDHRRSTRARRRPPVPVRPSCEAVRDGRLQGGQGCIEVRFGRRLHGSQLRGLRRLRPAGQECTETRLRSEESRDLVGQTRRQLGVARQREEVLQGQVGLVEGVCGIFRPGHVRGGRRRGAVEGPCREHLESRRRCPHLPYRREKHDVPLRQFGIERFGFGHVGNPEEGPTSAIRVSTMPSRTMARWGAYHRQGSRTFFFDLVLTAIPIGTFVPFHKAHSCCSQSCGWPISGPRREERRSIQPGITT